MDAAVQDSPLKAKDYKSDYKPIWCPGCGDFSVLASITKALAELQIAKEDATIISGIGCSSRIPAYTRVYGFHGVHGRALALAAGVKLARPELTVFVTGGDGDGFSIGGNHFLHACRRNVDMTYVVMDNQVYGMTKGQASPTTSPEWEGSKLTPRGTGVNPFNPASIALASGANFIARGFSGDPNGVAKLIVDGVRHPGFSVIQVLSPCITFRPEQRDWKSAVHPFKFEPTTDPVLARKRLSDDDGFNVGVLYAGDRPIYAPEQNVTADVESIQKKFTV
jgi:2-oxoglutarate/2-oxoacid ferredoxin oxidoreductase subunit beta